MVGYWKRLGFAFRTFFSILDYGRIPDEVQTALGPAPAAPAPTDAAGVADGAVQMLALLQRDGRFIDFLMEDLGAYQDAQIGAAVRDVHAGCRQALDRYLALEPVLAGVEEQPVTVEPGVDPARIRLVGNATGSPPFQGVLRHRGWRAARVALPPLPAPSGRPIVAPAEVEVP